MIRGSFMRHAMTRHALVAVLIVVAVALAGCGGSGGGPGSPTAAALLAEGWDAFESGDFEAARAKFVQVLEMDSSLLEGDLGIGWCDAFLGDLALAEGRLAEIAALPATGENAEIVRAALGGLAVIRLAQDDADGAIAAGTALLESDAGWVFDFRASVNADDVRLAMAEAYMTQGPDSYDEAQALLDVLAPGNGLDPESPGTWVVGGTTYASYDAALLTALMDVEAEIGETELLGSRHILH